MRLVATLLAFFFAVGVAAHALDELHGRPLQTTIPAAWLVGLGAGGLLIACALGLVGVATVGPGLLVFIAIGPLLVLGYNLELFGGWIHTDVGFAASWGAFPVLVGYFVQAEHLDLAAALGGDRGPRFVARATGAEYTGARATSSDYAPRRQRHDAQREHEGAERFNRARAPRTRAHLSLVGDGRVGARADYRSSPVAKAVADELGTDVRCRRSE